MKILFSPSEAKYKDGNNEKFNSKSFIFPELYSHRLEIIEKYQEFINKASNEQIAKLIGTKKQDIIDYYSSDIFTRNTKKVIQRYDGVAYDYLKYEELSLKEKEYIDKNVLIFSNLFGPILAGDTGLPDYKLKQGEKLDGQALEVFYKKHFSSAIDKYLENDDVLDLRAGFYEKFYKLNKPYTTMKFIKDGKVVSHWAKAYRGIILNTISKNNINSIEELMNLEINNLVISEIQEKNLKKEIIYNIV
ncbi:MAG: YaaA family protein [Poseidonibacter sp.]